MLCWDNDGYSLWAKRLEKGRFQLPSFDDGAVVAEVDGTTLAMILGGVDLQSAKRRKRFQVKPTAAASDASNDRGRSKPATEGRLKTSHLEGRRMVRSASASIAEGSNHGKSTQDGKDQ